MAAPYGRARVGDRNEGAMKGNHWSLRAGPAADADTFTAVRAHVYAEEHVLR